MKADSMRLLLVLAGSLWLCSANMARAEEIRDYYAEPGINPFKDAINQHLNEHIDPFSGTLQLKHTDLSVPGNGGLDININRVYTSLQTNDYPRPSIYGMGWTMSFGRIVAPPGHHDKLCNQSLWSVTTNDNPSLELPDGGRELLVLNGIQDDGSLITRSNWKAECIGGTEPGMIAISPEGTRYTMNEETMLDGEPSWLTTRIEDVHGNWIEIEYGTSVVGEKYVLGIYRSEENGPIRDTGSLPVVTYEYALEGQAGIHLTAIVANGQRWE